MKKEIKRIAVFTSGGDAPGMNAAIRAIVRNAINNDLHIYGVHRGYEGMINGDIRRLETSDVSNIIHRGGTVLKTARSMRFMTPEGRKQAYENLVDNDIDALIAIGGNGTFTGAKIFMSEYPDIAVLGIPGTIDNDLFGTDFTVGFDTALNTAVQAVDKIRDTADSHNRLFFVEVMGRNSGYIALHTAIAGGAGGVLLPEEESNIDDLVKLLKRGAKRSKLFSIVIVAEGNHMGTVYDIARQVSEKIDFYDDIKVTVIGHLQRGGSPSAFDRVLASILGFTAVEGLLEGKTGMMVGIKNNNVSYTAFADAISKSKTFNKDSLRMAHILAQ
ncbi:MAG TPA: 6-phosphofructokinase [Saprospiraceae bacterium]|nr:6-phosphofructokinase [Saprospiraceae bacterium]HNM25659.1 6-phosphofructokinase [Saprospiraceae bacterium]